MLGPRFEPDANKMSFLDAFATKGFLTARRLIDPELIAMVHEEYVRQYGDLRCQDLPAHHSVGERRVMFPIKITGPLLHPAIYAHPLLGGILGGLLGHDFLIDSFGCVAAFAGAPQQQVHRDHPALFPGTESCLAVPTFAVTVVIPLLDLTPVTGTTEAYAGSHLATQADNEEILQREPERPYLNMGDCLVMDYRLLHSGMPNNSQQDRPLLYIVYARHWFIDMVNFRNLQRINLDTADALTIPRSARRLFARKAPNSTPDPTVALYCKGAST